MLSEKTCTILALAGFAALAGGCAGVPAVSDILPTASDVEVLAFRSQLLEGEEPVSTGIEDATFDAPSLDEFDPTTFTPLGEMPRTDQSGFFILPGTYGYEVESYCLRAGTHSPRTGGDGYVYAPLKGSRAAIVRHILERSHDHPEVAQRDIQMLLWAIVARARLSDLDPSLQGVARRMLSDAEVRELDGGALGLVPDEVFDRATEHAPAGLRRVLDAQRDLRDLLAQPTRPVYEELEAVAVRAGVAPAALLAREIPWGRWSLHPEGFYVRYLPDGYTRTRIELHQPPFDVADGPTGGTAAQQGRELPTFNPAGGAAMPGNTGSQRLGQSGRKPGSADAPLGRVREATGMISTGSSVLTVAKPLGNWGPLLPSWMAGEVVNRNLDAWGGAINQLGGDPPRSDYKEYATPVRLQVDPVTAGPGLSHARAAAYNHLVEESLWVTSLLRAAVITQDRLGGAMEADDRYWASEQARVLTHYKREAGVTMMSVADLLDAFFAVAKQEGVTDHDVYVNGNMVRDYQSQLRIDGFHQEALDAAEAIGMSLEELEESRRIQTQVDPRDVLGSFFDLVARYTDALRDGGRAWSLLPEVDPYWER